VPRARALHARKQRLHPTLGRLAAPTCSQCSLQAAAEGIAEAYFASLLGRPLAFGRAALVFPAGLDASHRLLSARGDWLGHYPLATARALGASDVRPAATLTLAAWIIAIKFRCPSWRCWSQLFGTTIFMMAGRWEMTQSPQRRAMRWSFSRLRRPIWALQCFAQRDPRHRQNMQYCLRACCCDGYRLHLTSPFRRALPLGMGPLPALHWPDCRLGVIVGVSAGALFPSAILSWVGRVVFRGAV